MLNCLGGSYLVEELPCGWLTVGGTAFVPWLCRCKLMRCVLMQIIAVCVDANRRSYNAAGGENRGYMLGDDAYDHAVQRRMR